MQPPPVAASVVGTAPAKVALTATPAASGAARSQLSDAAAAAAPATGAGTLETSPKPQSARPDERPLSGIVLGALPDGRMRTAPDSSPAAPASASPAPAGRAAQTATTASLAACLATRPAGLNLGREETLRLIKRGQEFMGQGRVSAARLVFQRAADACDKQAALALAATYDPIMLERLGIAMLDPDVAAARSWYEKAKELGSPEASRQLELLSHWHP